MDVIRWQKPALCVVILVVITISNQYQSLIKKHSSLNIINYVALAQTSLQVVKVPVASEIIFEGQLLSDKVPYFLSKPTKKYSHFWIYSIFTTTYVNNSLLHSLLDVRANCSS